MQRLATLAAQYRVPAIGPMREFAAEGGLLSYGTNIHEVNRQAGIVTAKGSRARGRLTCQLCNRPSTSGDQSEDRQGARSCRRSFSPALMR